MMLITQPSSAPLEGVWLQAAPPKAQMMAALSTSLGALDTDASHLLGGITRCQASSFTRREGSTASSPISGSGVHTDLVDQLNHARPLLVSHPTLPLPERPSLSSDPADGASANKTGHLPDTLGLYSCRLSSSQSSDFKDYSSDEGELINGKILGTKSIDSKDYSSGKVKVIATQTPAPSTVHHL